MGKEGERLGEGDGGSSKSLEIPLPHLTWPSAPNILAKNASDTPNFPSTWHLQGLNSRCLRGSCKLLFVCGGDLSVLTLPDEDSRVLPVIKMVDNAESKYCVSSQKMFAPPGESIDQAEALRSTQVLLSDT